MSIRKWWVGLVGLVLAAGSASLATAEYVFVDLHPKGSGSRAWGGGDGQVVGRWSTDVYYDYHAVVWDVSTRGYAELQPTGFDITDAFDAWGGQQVGVGKGPATGGVNHAMFWSGSASSYIDRNPAGFNESWAVGIGDGRAVGHGLLSATGACHALLWTATETIDLNPSGFGFSEARENSGGRQIGHGFGEPTAGEYHAVLWAGSASSYVDIHPSGYTYSFGFAMSGNQAVGAGYLNGSEHALRWNLPLGSAPGVFDLHPAGYDWSGAYGVSGELAAGVASKGGVDHALLWTGTSGSYVDLHALVPAGYSNSWAWDVDEEGNVIGQAWSSADNNYHAVMWQASSNPVPEPSTLIIWSSLGAIGLIAARRRKRIAPIAIIRTGLMVLVMPFVGTFASVVHGAYIWSSYNGHEYALTQTRNNWAGAEAEAVSVGGHLATINDDAELQFISYTFRDSYILPYPPDGPYPGNGRAVWIGLEYQGSGWQWVTGEPYTGFPPPNAPGNLTTPYGPGWHPVGGPHAYLHTDYHPNPMTVNNDPAEDTDSYWYPYGVIERSGGSTVPEPSTLVIGTGLGAIGVIAAWRRWRRKASDRAR